MDGLLQNAWGLAYAPGNPFWISDENDGWSTLYNGAGVPQSLQVIVPPASGSGPGMPTGLVYNGSSEFKIDTWTSLFLFATLDGTIQGWSDFNPSATLIAVNNSANKASYTGLAITSKTSGNFIYAADTVRNLVDMYDGNFKFVKEITDPKIPKGFTVLGVQDIKGKVYVSYANAAGGPGGYIDIFTESGTFVKTFAKGKPLNQPWGFAVAPSNFGPLSNTLLISNNTNTGHDQWLQSYDRCVCGYAQELQGQADYHQPALGDRIRWWDCEQREEESALLYGGTEQWVGWIVRSDRVQVV